MKKIIFTILFCFISSQFLSYGVTNLAFNEQFPLRPNVENSLIYKWAKKPVLDSLLIDDMETSGKWIVKEGPVTIKLSDERSIDGKHSLNYRTIMRDTTHMALPENRTKWGTFGGEQGGGSKVGLTFDEPQDWSNYNRISIWVYIHPSSTPIHHFFLDIVNEGTDYNTVTPRHDSVIEDLEPGKWYEVLWEISDVPRDKVREFNIFQTLIGVEPGNDLYETFDFDRLQLQRVDPDHYDGWDIPKGQMAYSHIGYRPDDHKEAIASWNGNISFEIFDEKGKVVFKGTPKELNYENGDFALLDFSDFNSQGLYSIKYGDTISEPFPIDDNIWLLPIHSGINFYYCQRCGFPVEGIHDVCHQDWTAFYGDEVKHINGGWHDAGDLSQGYFRTAMGTYALLRNLANLQSTDNPELVSKLKDEIQWGLNWLLKNHFSDGQHMSWGRQRIYSDNIDGTIDDVAIKTDNVPWENFLGAAVMIYASLILPDLDANTIKELKEIAIDNYEEACKARKNDILELSWGATAASLLYEITKENKYKVDAEKFGKLLTDCQETDIIGIDIPITGYFYTSPEKNRIVQNNHSAFYEAPLIALRVLCETFPDSESWIDWYAAAAIHADFLQKNGSKISAPYNLVPNAVYRQSDIDAMRNKRQQYFTQLQYDDGITLDSNHSIRTFPIWSGDLFHGGTSCHLSNSWALAEASQLRNDAEGLKLVGNQLEWIFGRNPFNQTLMYGVGYNYTPQFAYCTRNVVGSLAVGMDSMSEDAPHWNGSAYATCKEMWIEPVSRCMGTMAVYNENNTESGEQFKILANKSSDGNIYLNVNSFPSDNYDVDVLLWNATGENIPVKINDGTKDFSFPINALNPSKPIVAVVCLKNSDGKELRKDYTLKQ